jgi:hypothetical protein
MRTILILLLATDELSSTRNDHRRCHALSLVVVADQRPLLREFGLGINRRVRNSEGGANRAGQCGAYTSDEIIPCLDMRCGNDTEYSVDRDYDDDDDDDEEGEVAGLSSRGAIRRAFAESGSRGSSSRACGGGDRESSSAAAAAAAAAATARHGRSSGSGCTIVRLTGSDASSIRGLMSYATRFFDGVDDDDDDDDDDDECNSSGVMRNAGVFRIDDHVYAGYDPDVNGEGKMQFLDTRILPPNNEERSNNVGPILLPLEVGELVGKEILLDAHRGMDILLRIGTQITSAVLGMDSHAAGKLIDDGTRAGRRTTSRRKKSDEQRYESMMKDDVSNSYHRLIRYVKPPDQSSGGDDGSAAFGAHVDSTFLTLIPMPELPGLEVWCPSRDEEDVAAGEGGAKYARRMGGGEWVRPTAPLDRRDDDDERGEGGGDSTTHASCAYVIVLAGEFLQLTSNGRVPVCIHRVVPSKFPPAATGTESEDGGGGGGGGGGGDVPKYKPRVSAPMFLRPRRGEGAMLDVGKDLRLVSNSSRNPPSYSTATTTTTGDLRCDDERKSLYYEKGLIDECDAMHLWSAHEMMKGK